MDNSTSTKAQSTTNRETANNKSISSKRERLNSDSWSRLPALDAWSPRSFWGEGSRRHVCRGRVSLWRLNQSAPGINYLARSSTVEKAHSPSPYSPSMAQASVRGACGFVLVVNSEVSRIFPSGHAFVLTDFSL